MVRERRDQTSCGVAGRTSTMSPGRRGPETLGQDELHGRNPYRSPSRPQRAVARIGKRRHLARGFDRSGGVAAWCCVQLPETPGTDLAAGGDDVAAAGVCIHAGDRGRQNRRTSSGLRIGGLAYGASLEEPRLRRGRSCSGKVPCLGLERAARRRSEECHRWGGTPTGRHGARRRLHPEPAMAHRAWPPPAAPLGRWPPP